MSWLDRQSIRVFSGHVGSFHRIRFVLDRSELRAGMAHFDHPASTPAGLKLGGGAAPRG